MRTTAEKTSTSVPLPAIEEPPPTEKGLVGTWSRIGLAGLIRFRADGEFRIARNKLDLRASPFAVGTYDIEGDTITFSDACNWVWKVGLAARELHVVVVEDVEDGCDFPPGTELQFVRLPGR